MPCCTCSTAKFINRAAGWHVRRFLRRGLDAPQRLLAEGIERAGIADSTLLEIGCGVGGLHLTLLARGAARAFGIDTSPRMIEKARELAARMGLKERTDYAVGDVVCEEYTVPPADAVILDKVLCCYADVEQLIRTSTGKALQLYAISYPRDGFLARTAFSFASWMGELLHRSFHPFYHEPQKMEERVTMGGFTEVYSAVTPVWQVKIYRRN